MGTRGGNVYLSMCWVGGGVSGGRGLKLSAETPRGIWPLRQMIMRVRLAPEVWHSERSQLVGNFVNCLGSLVSWPFAVSG